ncbi:MAG: 4-hydroxy-3-methylbut-2-en-1-yl diphosphate synthase [Parcubacteria group bacterium GW2011_GWA1_36_12]|nr:MAG: 4-hydroxy-3-methylbut-2-en-1-yl diphosphate synthase [Parcubacteria group bacterium GW2011_GWA1_36_12]
MPEREITNSHEISERRSRLVKVGSLTIGFNSPIVVQSMCATKTQDIEATVAQVGQLSAAGAGIVRIAVDSRLDALALREIRARTTANLSVDLQENWRLVDLVAPFVDKIRYNPGHLYHHEKSMSVRDKVAHIAEVADRSDCAIRIGVNCGSIDPELAEKFRDDDISPMIESALEHCDILDQLGFNRYVLSLKDSDPRKVVEANTRFSKLRPDVPLHLGVTEAGLPPGGINKSRYAMGKLLSSGIGDTLRFSLTVSNERKSEEVLAAKQLITDVSQGESSSFGTLQSGLDIISCPSCSRVENEAFVELAEKVKVEAMPIAERHNLTIAVMGCRVNGPGETDDANLGLWCGPTHVNLKKGSERLGAFTYEEIVPRMLAELNLLAREK